jgi:hypothetical protein
MMMIAIVVAATFVVYAYSSGLLGSLQGAQPQRLYTNQITLEYYNWPSNDLHNLTLFLRNTGSGRAILADFFVNGTSVTLVSNKGNCFTYTATNTFLPPTSSCVAILTIPISVKITAGYAYSVRLVTRDGSVFTYTLIAGQSGTPS